MAAGERLDVAFAFDALRLGVGSYSVTVALHAGADHTMANYDWWDRALVFQVAPGTTPYGVGVCAFPVQARWTSGADPESMRSETTGRSGESAARAAGTPAT